MSAMHTKMRPAGVAHCSWDLKGRIVKKINNDVTDEKQPQKILKIFIHAFYIAFSFQDHNSTYTFWPSGLLCSWSDGLDSARVFESNVFLYQFRAWTRQFLGPPAHVIGFEIMRYMNSLPIIVQCTLLQVIARKPVIRFFHRYRVSLAR